MINVQYSTFFFPTMLLIISRADVRITQYFSRQFLSFNYRMNERKKHASYDYGTLMFSCQHLSRCFEKTQWQNFSFQVIFTYSKTASPIYFKVKSDTVKCLRCEEIYFIVPILV